MFIFPIVIIGYLPALALCIIGYFAKTEINFPKNENISGTLASWEHVDGLDI